MHVLVTGGYGFIGSFVAERFYREGHKVFIIDNLSTGKKENVNFKHRFAYLNIESELCEEIFRINKFDIVIHLAGQAGIGESLENPVSNTKTNVLGLTNMLTLAQKYGVRKFVFASSAAVYGQPETLPANEQSLCAPVSPYGMNKWIGEYYCQKWSDVYNLDTLCFRISNVYGPKQMVSGEGGVVASFINSLLKKEPLTVFGDGTQTRDFIYVEDVAAAIYRSILSDVSGVFNLSSNEETSINELIALLKQISETTEVNYRDLKSGDILHSHLDNSLVKRELDWVPKYSFSDGLAKTYDFFVENTKKRVNKSEKEGIIYTFFKKIKPYTSFLENTFLFLLTIILELTAQQAFDEIDFKILYILFIGIWLGKTQSIIASGLTIILYIYSNLLNGREFISLFIDDQTLLNFAIYIFLGIVSGYVIDKKNAREQSTRLELEVLQNKHVFLTEVYHETRMIKDDLQAQIINSEDSIGKVYSIVKKLDSLEKEHIFSEAVTVLEQTLKTNAIAIYIVGQNRQYLRLVSNSKTPSLSIPRSVKIGESEPIQQVVHQKKMYINKEFSPNNPMIMAPILRNEKTIAVICIYETHFEQFTLNYHNLLTVVIDLISVSLTRAYEYTAATFNERYVDGTLVLNPEYFSKLLEYKDNMQEKLGVDYSLIELKWTSQFKQHLYLLENSLRETDYIGMDKNGQTFILFSNTSEQEAEIVLQRLQRLKLPVEKFVKEEIYG